MTFILLNISGRKFPHYGVILIPCYIVPLTQIIKNILSINKLKFKVELVALTSFIIGIACKDPIITQIGEIKKQFIESLNLNTEVSKYIIENTEVTDTNNENENTEVNETSDSNSEETNNTDNNEAKNNTVNE